MTYKIAMYRQLFQRMLVAENYKKVKNDYNVLREHAVKISSEDIKINLEFKHRIQWIIYLYFFKIYRIFH